MSYRVASIPAIFAALAAMAAAQPAGGQSVPASGSTLVPQYMMDLSGMGWDVLQLPASGNGIAVIRDPHGYEREAKINPLHGRLEILPLRHPVER